MEALGATLNTAYKVVMLRFAGEISTVLPLLKKRLSPSDEDVDEFTSRTESNAERESIDN